MAMWHGIKPQEGMVVYLAAEYGKIEGAASILMLSSTLKFDSQGNIQYPLDTGTMAIYGLLCMLKLELVPLHPRTALLLLHNSIGRQADLAGQTQQSSRVTNILVWLGIPVTVQNLL